MKKIIALFLMYSVHAMYATYKKAKEYEKSYQIVKIKHAWIDHD